MTANPNDELDFRAFPLRVLGELDDRLARAKGALKYHNAFLDDCLRAILPNDLILMGARTGVGKTEIALAIAVANARVGKRAHYFALEAEERELERRKKYALLSQRIYADGHPDRGSLNYTDWLLGDCERVVGHLNEWADYQIMNTLGTMKTYYRGRKFSASDLQRHFEKIAPHTDLVVLDHFHYVDTNHDDSENRAQAELAQIIRDLALVYGKPVIVVAHLRKSDRRMRQLCVDDEDFHGASQLAKNATQIIGISRAETVEASKWYLAPTFIRVVKDRRAGASPLVAVCDFDRRTKRYEEHYTLGLLGKGGTEWDELRPGDAPSWARNHCQLASTRAPNQTEIGDHA